MVEVMLNKKLLIVIFLLLIPTVFGLFDDEIFLLTMNLREGSNIDLNPNVITTQGTISLANDPVIIGDLTIRGDLFLLGNLSFLGDIINVTILNQNITGSLQISGNLDVENITADYFIGDLIGTANNSDYLDGIDSTQFLRSDINDTLEAYYLYPNGTNPISLNHLVNKEFVELE